MKRTLLVVIAAIVLSGCAVGNKHVYNDIEVKTSARSGKSISVASVDQREYVVSGQSRPELVGMQRGGFGNPFDVLTASGRALTSEFTTAIRSALERNGARVVAVETKPAGTSQPAMAQLIASASERLLLLLVKEWIGDSQVNTTARYDLLLTVADSNGKTLAAKTYVGTRDLGGSFVNPPAHSKEVMPKVFREAIEALLNSPEIVSALQ